METPVFDEKTFELILEAPDSEIKELISLHMAMMHPTDPNCIHRRTVVALGYTNGLRRQVEMLESRVEADGNTLRISTRSGVATTQAALQAAHNAKLIK